MHWRWVGGPTIEKASCLHNMEMHGLPTHAMERHLRGRPGCCRRDERASLPRGASPYRPACPSPQHSAIPFPPSETGTKDWPLLTLAPTALKVRDACSHEVHEVHGVWGTWGAACVGPSGAHLGLHTQREQQGANDHATSLRGVEEGRGGGGGGVWLLVPVPAGCMPTCGHNNTARGAAASHSQEPVI